MRVEVFGKLVIYNCRATNFN